MNFDLAMQMTDSLSCHSRNAKKSVNVASPKAEYDLAAQLGQASKNVVLCRERYTMCPYTGEQMMAALRSSQI